MWRYTDRTRWLAALLPALIGCAGCSSQPAASKASTPAEAVEALIKAVKPIESEDAESAAERVAFFQAIAPHLADSSRETVECFLAVVPEARDHDLQAKKVFGAALEKAEGYSPAEGFLAMMMSMGTPLAHIPLGAKAEIVKQAEKSPTEVMFRVRWRKGESPKTQSFEDTLVAVKEGGGWKVLLPLSGGVEFGSNGVGDQEEEYVRRKQQDWDATSVRNNNQAATKQLQVFRSRIGRLTQEVKDGKYPRIEAYLDAMNADPDDRPPATEGLSPGVDEPLESFEATGAQLDAQRSITLQFHVKEGDTFHYESTFTTPPDPPRKHRSTQRIVKVTDTAVHEIDSTTPDLIMVMDRRGYTVDVLELQGGRSIKDHVADEVWGIFGRLIFPERPVKVGDTWNADNRRTRVAYRLVHTGTLRGCEVAEIHSGSPGGTASIKIWVELATGMLMREKYSIGNTTTVTERLPGDP